MTPARRAWQATRQTGGVAVGYLYWRRRAARRPGAVAILHAGRCGSNAFGHLLHQHPRVYCDGEPFERSNLSSWRRRLQGVAPEPCLANLPRLLSFAGDRWYVGSILAGQAALVVPDPSHLPDALAGAGYDRFVVLRRRNLLRVIASRLVASAEGALHARLDQASRRRAPVPLPLVDRRGDSLRARLASFDAFYRDVEAALAARGRPSLALVFEDDVETDPRRAYGKVCAFLGIAPAPVRVELRRTGDAPLPELVANLEEVRAHLAGTPYAWMAA